jgi:hypothetical protein
MGQANEGIAKNTIALRIIIFFMALFKSKRM